MGHEFSGTVSGLGEGITDLEVGENIVVEPYFLCGECAERKAGNYNLCAKMGFIGLAGGGGGLSQSELGEARKEKARSTGVADHVIDPSREDIVARVRALTDGDGADVCFECTSVNAVLDELFDAVRPAGVIVNVSIWSRPATIAMQKLVLKETNLRGTIAYAGDHPQRSNSSRKARSI